jgi:hypothetical protein
MVRIRTTFVGIWVLKWIVAPLFCLGIVAFSWDLYSGKRKCEQIREERGYLESRYLPSSGSLPAQCVLTGKIEDSGITNFNAKLVIELY